MELREFANRLYERLTQAMDQQAGLAGTQREQMLVSVIRTHIQELKEYLVNYSFFDKQEEINFFREIKPRFTSLLIYHTTVYYWEIEKQPGFALDYYHKEFEKLGFFFSAEL